MPETMSPLSGAQHMTDWTQHYSAPHTALASSGDHAELADTLSSPFNACCYRDKCQALIAEVAALRSSLTKANDGFEEYERKFYLEQIAREKAERKLAEAVGLLANMVRWADDPSDEACGMAREIEWAEASRAFLSKEAERG